VRPTEGTIVAFGPGPGAPAAAGAAAMSTESPNDIESTRGLPGPLAALLGVAAPALVTPAALAIFGRQDHPNVAILYLFVVALVSLRLGYRPSLLAAVTSAACFDYFFTIPYHSLAIAQGRQLMTFAGLLGTAIFVSTLNERMRKQARAARDNERRTERQAALVWALAEAESLEAICARAAEHLGSASAAAVRIVLRGGDGRFRVARGEDGTLTLTPEELAAIESAATRLAPSGAGTATFSGAGATYLPLRTPRGCVGVVALEWRPGVSVRPSSLVRSMTEQVAIAIERTLLADEKRAAEMEAEIERTRGAVLSSVSHDLRTPLAVIASAASTLAEQGSRLGGGRRAEMSGIINAEARRLNELLRSLLDVTRLQAGALHLSRSWQSFEGVVARVRAQLEGRSPGRSLVTRLPPGLPPLYIDPILVEQVLLNLLDNALKHSTNDDPIEIVAAPDGSSVRVEVIDHGTGVGPAELPRIFERFYRGGGAAPGGLGLGLTIARGIVRAHGGQIWASPTEGRGLTVTFTLPLEGEPAS
jgi:two-component system sensor histidine kinase KdpD